MDETEAQMVPAPLGPVERMVRPRAWAIFLDSGNARMWSALQPHVQKLADAEGLTVTPLYDQAALDAAAEHAARVAREADALDDMAALGQHWTRNRERGRMPNGIRSAMLMVAREVLMHVDIQGRETQQVFAEPCGLEAYVRNNSG